MWCLLRIASHLLQPPACSQIDYDKKSTIFNVVTVLAKELDLIEPYPNPTNDYLHFDVEAGKYFIRISDVNGILIPSSFLSIETETGRLTLDMNSLETGIYIVHLTNKTNVRRASYKVVKK